MYNITALRSVVVLAVFTACKQTFLLSIFIADKKPLEHLKAHKLQDGAQNQTGLLQKLWNRCKFSKNTKKCFLLNAPEAVVESVHTVLPKLTTGERWLCSCGNPGVFVGQAVGAGSTGRIFFCEQGEC